MNKLIASNGYFGTSFNGSVEVSVFLAIGLHSITVYDVKRGRRVEKYIHFAKLTSKSE